MEKILKAIEEKAEEEIEKISQEKERVILELEKEYLKKTAEKQKEQKGQAESQIAKEIEEFEKSWQVKLNFKTQEEKNKIIEAVYEKARQKLSELGDAELKKIIKYLVDFLPKHKKGLIEAGSKTAKILQDVIVDNDIKINSGLEEEGFVFKSQDVEVDMRLSQIIFQLQELANPELVKMLFS